MSTISMKKLYGLAYQWIDHKKANGMPEMEANKLATLIIDFFDFVWKHKAGKGPQNPIKS
jgi:hypothetical protein